MGRFLQPDPLGPSIRNPQTLNPYAYVLNNPLRYTDPTGMRWVDADGEPLDAGPFPHAHTANELLHAFEWVGQESPFWQGGPCHGGSINSVGTGACKATQTLWLRETYHSAMVLKNLYDLNLLSWSPSQRDFLRQSPWLFGTNIDQVSPGLSDAYMAAAIAVGLGLVSPTAKEIHHFLPKAAVFQPWYAQARLDHKNFTLLVTAAEHRLAAYGGVHTGPNNLNTQMKRFMRENPNASAREILGKAQRIHAEFKIKMPAVFWDRLPR
jgi:hypothetical protein